MSDPSARQALVDVIRYASEPVTAAMVRADHLQLESWLAGNTIPETAVPRIVAASALVDTALRTLTIAQLRVWLTTANPYLDEATPAQTFADHGLERVLPALTLQASGTALR
jgi:hypothetical protein